MRNNDNRTARVFAEAETEFGFVPKCYREIAFAPAALERHHDCWRTLRDGPLTREEVLAALVLVAGRRENAQQLECWRRYHQLRGFEGGFDLYVVAPELVSPALGPVSRAVRHFLENEGRFSDELIIEMFRAGRTREWLHAVLFAIGFAERNCQLSFLYEVDFDVAVK